MVKIDDTKDGRHVIRGGFSTANPEHVKAMHEAFPSPMVQALSGKSLKKKKASTSKKKKKK